MKTDNFRDTPIIPEEVYNNLPPLLKRLTDQFENQREKDVILTSMLTILSGCFSKIEGLYDKNWLSSNLYSFVVAPPASGKGTMKYAQILGKTIQEQLMVKNEEAKNIYDAEFRLWKRNLKKDSKTPPPKKPKYPILFIPGNTSSTAIYKRLLDNSGIGIICETEADTLSGAISQDWGGFSDMLRKAFHHDPLSLNRSGDDLLFYIERPNVSVLLTGTPDQVPRLIGSAQDGLCSRFLFYCYSRPLEWLDPTPCTDCPDLSELFEKDSKTVASIAKQLTKSRYSFKLNEAQFSELSANFAKKLKSIELFEGSGAASAVIRLGVIVFRLAMILTVVRKMDDLEATKELECSDTDFHIVMLLANVYFEHAMFMYSILPKGNRDEINPNIRRFYLNLPKGEGFSRKEANDIGCQLKIKERSVGNYLEKLVELGLLENLKFGFYLAKQE